LLVSVAERYPCVVVSGRRLDDLAPRLEGIPLRMVFGNFGYEPTSAGRHPPADVATWVAALTRRLPLQEGLVIEDKQYSVAIHFRHARRQREVRRAIANAVRGLHGVRVLSGTKTITLLPQGGPDKGAALQSARSVLECDTAIYVGDDGTDEAAFGSAPPESLLAIRVGRAGETRARFRLARQTDIDALLRALLALRSGGGAAAAPSQIPTRSARATRHSSSSATTTAIGAVSSRKRSTRAVALRSATQ
jgi:trehalose-phosphatase